jgi:hypothetical protein
MKMFTAEEMVQILSCLIHRKHDIQSLENNPHVSAEHKNSMENELRIMKSVEQKLFPTP